jgi:hypothetical protein
VLFIETHGNPNAFGAHIGAGVDVPFDGTQFGQVLKSQSWFQTLLKDNPDSAIYVNACRSGHFPDGIGQQLAQELGRTVYAPTTSSFNPVTTRALMNGNGSTLISIYGENIGTGIGASGPMTFPTGGGISTFHPPALQLTP